MSDDPILAALTRLEAGQADMSGRLIRLEAGQADMSGRLIRLEAGQADTSDRLTRLEAGQTSLRTDFLAELGSTRAAIMEKVEGLQDSVTAIRDDIIGSHH